MNKSSPCALCAVVYEICPAARIIELQHRRLHDSLRISASDQWSSHAGVEIHIGACSFVDGQFLCSVKLAHAHPEV